ncbi:MAG: TonB-dependent receptor [Novosphingobium sp.]|nr:TonB-dependent receptor [Novosphingobium sp.]
MTTNRPDLCCQMTTWGGKLMLGITYKGYLLLGVAATGLAAAEPALAQASAEAGGLEEIIVTAQKREQSVQDVPIAVTAVTQETLEVNRITTVNDLGSVAPGVTVRPSAGGIQVPSFTIRGQNSFGVVAGSDKQVSIYLDGVYISSPKGSIFDLPDIARLEVLRGPQGTLFGRNATAGAVSVVTRDPTGEAHVKVQGSVGNQDSYRFRLSADLPQMGPFSGYFSFARNYRRGDIRNAAAGTVWDRTLSPDPNLATVERSPKYLGNVDANSYFAALKFEPSDSFKMVYKYDRNEDNGTPEGTAISSYNPAYPGLGAGAALIGPIFNALYNSQEIYLNDSLQSPDVITNSWVIPRVQRVSGHSLTATWRASDSITVKNIAAYRQSSVFAPSAIDGVSALTFTQEALVPYATFIAFSTNPPADAAAAIPGLVAQFSPLVGNRVLITASGSSTIAKQWSDELQVNYGSDNLQITAGALWFHSKEEAGGPEGVQNTFSFFSNPFISPSGVVPLGNEGRYFNKATSIAAYLQAEYKFNEQFELVLGGRITRDKKTSRFRWDNLIGGVVVPRPDIIPEPYKKTKPNFMVGLNWTPSRDTLIYGKYSTSFVSGGSVAGIEFVPEVAKSWELGLKADFLDRRLRTNLALFYVDYSNFQQPSSTTSQEAVAFLNAAYGALGTALASNLSTFVQQSHDVRAKGFELEVTAAPTDGLTIGGSLSYTDAEFRNIDPVFLAAQGGEYKAFVRPKWTASAYASYETQPLIGDATLSFRLDGLYRSRLDHSGNPSVQLDRGVPAELLSSKAHWKLNGRVALRHIQFGGLEGELAVWGRNLTNKRYATSSLFLPWAVAQNYDQGRSYGLDLSIEF